ncbi:3'-5' exonuclease domain-containing protein 2 [Paludibacter sp. 221]|uniref:3'-5' exonuclease n=1 Tax=Paludibacter sp. 221 TaxID=2302939 RepID=UPI0013D6C42A|nr:3'-5' exonuclease [Paludibacter sp. 221]NDV47759.1 3'-5' exonuclease domain-containing protein 2 [Paludibacter sp. 221]
MFKPKITKEEINLLPIVHFGGEIIVVDNVFGVEAAIDEIRKHPILGIDTETKPSFKKGKNNRVSLIQISTLEKCFLFRLNKIDFPPALINFLGDNDIKKIGLSLRDDFAGLNKFHRIKPKNIIDIQSIVKSYGIMELSLQKVYAIIFGEKISKSQQLSNWENEELTEQQQRYAATDAWACLKIYLELMRNEPLSPKEIEQLILEWC